MHKSLITNVECATCGQKMYKMGKQIKCLSCGTAIKASGVFEPKHAANKIIHDPNSMPKFHIEEDE